jgi:hypothetical protein
MVEIERRRDERETALHMATPRQRFALLIAVPHVIRQRGRTAVPGTAAWEKHFPELQFMGDIDVVSFAEVPEGIRRWQAIAQWVGEHAGSLDGIIIVHPREHVVPAAVVLDLQLHSLTIPVVVTIPSRLNEHDWRTNVVVALQTAVLNVLGPIVLDGNRIVRAGTLFWELPEVIGGAPAARLDFGVRRMQRRGGGNTAVTIHSATTDVVVTNIIPGLALPPIPEYPMNMMLRATSTPDWKALVAWSKQVPRGTKCMLQWSGGSLPSQLKSWGHLKTSEDEVAVVQAAWIFGQGENWKRAIKTVQERRPV